ncbi:MAG: hypothetical protein CVU47_00705 [Chloroflexi bacterium HGW-Chloroflexi-9]|nr:MAG: hypothetical protein CVU47_00705 [Chloroflexi bacterium HGW-Chloroflexi-9]
MNVMPDHQTSPGDLLQALLAVMPSPIATWAPDGRLLGCSAAFAALLGHSEEEIAAIGRVSLLEESDREAARERITTRGSGSRISWSFRARLRRADGEPIAAHCRVVPLVVGGDLLGDLFEVVELVDATSKGEALAVQAETYAELFEHISEAVWQMDDRRRMIWANPAAERLFGRTLVELQRTPMQEVLFDEGLRGVADIRERFDTGQRVPRRIEARIKRPDGEVRWLGGSLFLKPAPDGRFGTSWIVARDITAVKERERALTEMATEARQQALLDPLTGLGNRRAFDEALLACREQESPGRHAIIVVVDLDRLKAVNDEAGHAAGDEALRATAIAVQERIRAGDQAFRIGGDEFAIIAYGTEPGPLEARLARAITFRDSMPALFASVGSATVGVDSDDPVEAYRIADLRMYEMKRNDRP